MVIEQFITNNLSSFIFLIVLISVWDAIWKAIALWYSARRKQIIWFILILILNTIGIFPIIYLLIYRGKKAKK